MSARDAAPSRLHSGHFSKILCVVVGCGAFFSNMGLLGFGLFPVCLCFFGVLVCVGSVCFGLIVCRFGFADFSEYGFRGVWGCGVLWCGAFEWFRVLTVAISVLGA